MLPLQWKLPSPRRLLSPINLLRLLWLLLLFYLEHWTYLRTIRACSWQPSTPQECRLAIIADPQIVDENTYPRRGLGMWLTKIFTDRYMRRNWKMVMAQGPGTAIFLGDLMDGGREWEDDKYFFSRWGVLIVDGFPSTGGLDGCFLRLRGRE
jgi:ethanolamine phosphate phosphodiesterase